MKKDFEEIIEKFKEINKKGYIKGINNNICNSCGLTFEKLIDKKVDSDYHPDFKGIEIKTTHRFSRYPINLFCLNFDGPQTDENYHLLYNYGIFDKDFQNKKKLIINLEINKKVLVYKRYYFELINDSGKKYIYINIYDIDGIFLEKRGFVKYSSIEKRLNIKFKKLALIYSSKKTIDSDLYFRYYKICCYLLKDFKTFIKLINEGSITLTIMLRFAKSGFRKGKYTNKNIVFYLNKEDIEKLFKKIYSFEN